MLLLTQQSARSMLCISVLLFLSTTHALHVTPDSPCAARCGSSPDRTTGDDVVCQDVEYQTTQSGTRFEDCVTCELGSTHVDNSTGNTDVLWGLYNLRYAVSTCVYDFPTSKQSLSTPCQVTCATIADAFTLGITNTSQKSTDLNFCNSPAFVESTLNKCASCFNLTSDERFMSNFFQSLHAACRDPPLSGEAFPITPASIFASTAISAPPSLSTSPPKHLPKLFPLMVALPILVFLIITISTCFCCYMLVRRRRRQAKASGAMQRVHERYLGDWVGMSPTTPGGGVHDTPVSAASPTAWGKSFDMSPIQTKSFNNPTFAQVPANYASDDKKEPMQVHEQFFPPPPPGPPPASTDFGFQYMHPQTVARQDFVAPTLSIPQPARMKALRTQNDIALPTIRREEPAQPVPPPPPVQSQQQWQFQPPSQMEREAGMSPQTFVYDDRTDGWVKQQQEQGDYDQGLIDERSIGVARTSGDDETHGRYRSMY